MATDYLRTTFRDDGTGPVIDATYLNRLEGFLDAIAEGGSGSVVKADNADRVAGLLPSQLGGTPPVGAPYIRMPGDPLPDTLYPGTTWAKVSGSGNLAGTFPRFEGQYSGHENCVYNTVYSSQNKSHGHTVGATDLSGQAYFGSGGENNIRTHTWSGAFSYAGGPQTADRGTNNSSGIYIGLNFSGNHAHTLTNEGGTEARPVAVGIQHYRRAT